MNIKIISCVGPGGWDKYGKKFVESFAKYWPTDITLSLYYHDEAPPADATSAPNIEYINLLEVDPEVTEFREFANRPPFNGQEERGYNFRHDAYKFCHKVYATTHLAHKLHNSGWKGFLVWLDADTFTTKPVSTSWMRRLLPPDGEIIHLPRKPLPYSETSFVGFNLASPKTLALLADLRDAYVDKEVFAWQEWHDGFIFSRLLHLYENNGIKAYSLTPPNYDGIDAFAHSTLAERLVHLKGNLKNGGGDTGLPPGMQPLKIIPQDSMPKEHILNNAHESDKLLSKWLKHCMPHNRSAVIVSAGPSLAGNLERIRQQQKDGAYVVCVKHSLPILMNAGIIPDACVILDPRPVNAESTHGVLRTTLFDKVDPKTVFFIASMTDTSVTKYVLSKTSNVVGWFAWTQALAKSKPPEDHPVVTGGTCSAWRCFGLLRVLGFSKITAYGFDFVMDSSKPIDMELKDDKGRPKYFKIFIGEDDIRKEEITTGELAAGIQDVAHMLQQTVATQQDVEMVGESGAAFLWNFLVKKHGVNVPTIQYYDFEKEYNTVKAA